MGSFIQLLFSHRQTYCPRFGIQAEKMVNCHIEACDKFKCVERLSQKIQCLLKRTLATMWLCGIQKLSDTHCIRVDDDIFVCYFFIQLWHVKEDEDVEKANDRFFPVSLEFPFMEPAMPPVWSGSWLDRSSLTSRTKNHVSSPVIGPKMIHM